MVHGLFCWVVEHSWSLWHWDAPHSKLIPGKPQINHFFFECCSGRCFKSFIISSDLYNYLVPAAPFTTSLSFRFFDSGIAGDRVSFSSMRKVAEAFGNEFPQFNDQDRLKRTIGGPSCLADWVGTIGRSWGFPHASQECQDLKKTLMSMEGGSRKPGLGSLFVVFIYRLDDDWTHFFESARERIVIGYDRKGSIDAR